MIANKPIPFPNAHSLCKHIITAVVPNEALLLYTYASKCHGELTILEVGSDKGYSTVLLAQTGLPVIAVDPHIVGQFFDEESGIRFEYRDEDHESFKYNTKPYENITHIREFSEKVKLNHFVGFMFIDANHSWPHPKNDFLHFEESLLPGSYVAWHDYILFPGVTRSIDQLIEEGRLEMIEHVGTLCITRTPNA